MRSDGLDVHGWGRDRASVGSGSFLVDSRPGKTKEETVSFWRMVFWTQLPVLLNFFAIDACRTRDYLTPYP